MEVIRAAGVGGDVSSNSGRPPPPTSAHRGGSHRCVCGVSGGAGGAGEVTRKLAEGTVGRGGSSQPVKRMWPWAALAE